MGERSARPCPVPSLLPIIPAFPANVVTTASGVTFRIVGRNEIGHVDVARPVGGDVAWQIEARRAPSPISLGTLAGLPGESCDDLVGRDLADCTI
jgi:hypothetical protein